MQQNISDFTRTDANILTKMNEISVLQELQSILINKYIFKTMKVNELKEVHRIESSN